MQVGGSLLLRRGFRVIGQGPEGAIRLIRVSIGNSLVCEQARLCNDTGSAMRADGAHVEGSVLLRQGFVALGCADDAATVRLVSARIDGGLDFREARMRNPRGWALDLRSASVGWLRLPAEVVCRSQRDENTTSPGQIPCSEEGDDPLTAWVPDGELTLAGLTYNDLVDADNVEQWLLLLRRQRWYAAQPYQVLAAFHRSAGREADQRRILIAQQDDLRDKGTLGGYFAHARHRLLRLFLGYGYQTWRALICLVLVLGVAIGLGLLAGHTHANDTRYVAVHTDKTGREGTACSTVEQISLGVDRGLPIISTGIGDRCAFDSTSHTGQAFIFAAWVVQILAWAFATLVVAGYTGLIRRV